MFSWVKGLWHPGPATQDASGGMPIDPPSRVEARAGAVNGDSPIQAPEHDAFGVDPFSRAIARSIAVADASDGLVYAINGPWGSGKSSAINLILHHLAEPVAARRIAVTTFNPWWFSGAEALTVSFFQEMRATVGKSLDERARETMATIGSRVSSAGPLLGGIASLLATPAAGLAVAGGASLVERLTRLDGTVEGEHRKLAAALAAQDTRFLVVIDDVDRLSTDDALQMFKLVKSVGRLPNVIYLMAFDRLLAERMVAERFPSEGASYLDKVVQGAFELPMPDPDDLRERLLRSVDAVMGSPPDDAMPRFWNLFHDVVGPLLTTPRDAVRLGNAIAVAWPAVAGDVDRADFLAMEALRIFLPSVHGAVRAHPEMLTGTQRERNHDRAALEPEYDATFLGNLKGRRRDVARRALRRLFPRLDAIWANTWHGAPNRWQRDRLVCSPEHFRTYFAFGVTADAITAAESDALVAAAGRPGATAAALRRFLAMPRRKGGTRASLALQELSVRAGDIALADVEPFVRDIFAVADDLNVEGDADNGFAGFASNQNRLHWLLNNLLRDRFDLPFSSAVVRAAAPEAGLEWLVSLADRCKAVEEGREDDLVDAATATWLHELSTDRFRAAAAEGTLAVMPGIEALLYRWRDRADDAEVRTWTDARLADNAFVAALARDVVRASLSHAMGDRVARRTEYVHLAPLAPLVDVARLRSRISSMAGSPHTDPAHLPALERFLATPERDPARRG